MVNPMDQPPNPTPLKNHREASKAGHIARVSPYPHAFTDLGPIEQKFQGEYYFSRALLEKAAKEVEQARSRSQEPIQVDDSLSKWSEDKPKNKKGVSLSWCGLSRMVFGSSPYRILPVEIVPGMTFFEEKEMMSTHTIKPVNDDPLRIKAQQEPAPLAVAVFEKTRDDWEAGPQCPALKTKLTALSRKVRVRNIVCIGLGASRQQHTLASFMAQYLQNCYAEADGKTYNEIEICAFDPVYQYADVVAFEHFSPPIHVVSDPYHYLAINEHTLVYTAYCPTSVPLLQIAADICYPSGPAAFLTNEVWDDLEWFKENKVHDLDVWTPRIGKMMQMYQKDPMDSSMKPEEDWCRQWLVDLVLYVREDDRVPNVADEMVDTVTEGGLGAYSQSDDNRSTRMTFNTYLDPHPS
jgi:hypothetical protein